MLRNFLTNLSVDAEREIHEVYIVLWTFWNGYKERPSRLQQEITWEAVKKIFLQISSEKVKNYAKHEKFNSKS